MNLMQKAMKENSKAEYHLVLGSSLMVMPAMNFAKLFMKNGNISIVNLQNYTDMNIPQGYIKINGFCDITLALISTYLGLEDFTEEVQIFYEQNMLIQEHEKKQMKKNKIELNRINFGQDDSIFNSKQQHSQISSINNNKDNIPLMNDNYDIQQFQIGSKKYNNLIKDSLTRKVELVQESSRKLRIICKDIFGNEVTSIKFVKVKSLFASDIDQDDEILNTTYENWDYTQEFSSTKDFVIVLDEIIKKGNNDNRRLQIELDFYRNEKIRKIQDLSYFDYTQNDHPKIILHNKTILFPKLY